MQIIILVWEKPDSWCQGVWVSSTAASSSVWTVTSCCCSASHAVLLTTPDTNAVSIYTNQRAETLLPRLELRGEKEKPILGNCFRTSTRCSMAPLIWKELGEQNHSWLYETAVRPGLRKKQTSVLFLFFFGFFSPWRNKRSTGEGMKWERDSLCTHHNFWVAGTALVTAALRLLNPEILFTIFYIK